MLLKTLKERFESKYEAQTGGCWNWTASTRHGYGQFRVGDDTMQAHRVSYALCKGAVPEGMYVLHRCNNRACVNPDHLYLGTFSDNIEDAMVAKAYLGGRKLMWDDVVCIKKMLRDGIKQWLIAWTYQVSRTTINCISTRRTWSHVRI